MWRLTVWEAAVAVCVLLVAESNAEVGRHFAFISPASFDITSCLDRYLQKRRMLLSSART